MCPYSELFWSTFSRIRTNSVQMRENANLNNSEYGHISRSEVHLHFIYFSALPFDHVLSIVFNAR